MIHRIGNQLKEEAFSTERVGLLTTQNINAVYFKKSTNKAVCTENHNASEPFKIGNSYSENNIGSIGQSAQPQLSV